MTCRLVTGRPVKRHKNGGLGAKSHPKGKLRILLLRFTRAHRLMFFPNFMLTCRVTKNKFSVPVTKTPHFLPSCAPLAQGVKILTWNLSEILSGSIKVCRSYLRKADFQQLHICTSGVVNDVMFACNESFGASLIRHILWHTSHQRENQEQNHDASIALVHRAFCVQAYYFKI